MLKKKFILLGFLSFCLVASLFVGVVTSPKKENPYWKAIHELQSKVDSLNSSLVELQDRCMHALISPLTFKPTDERTAVDYIRNLTYISSVHGSHRPFLALVQLPHRVHVTNLTAFLFDNIDYYHVVLELWRLNPANTTSLEQMALVQTSDLDASLETFVVHDDSIENAQIDNENYVYALKLYSSHDGLDIQVLGLRGVIIEYEYRG